MFYGVIDQTPKKDILVVQGDWNAKVGRDACGDWQGVCGPFCNDYTNERGLRLVEFASCNDLVLANTFGHHKASRRWTWHSPNGQHHNQIDYILVREALPIRSEQCQNTKFSRSRHQKWSWLADDDLLPLPEKKSASQNTQDSSLTSKSWKIPMYRKPSKLW